MHYAIISCILAGVVLLTGCDLPNRVKQDTSIETIKPLVEERLIAPLGQASGGQFALPEKQPRRQLLQVRYHEKSLYQDDFLNILNRLAEQAPQNTASSAPAKIGLSPIEDTSSDLMPDQHILSMTEEEKEQYIAQRQIKRQILIDNARQHFDQQQQAYLAQIDTVLLDILIDLKTDIRGEITRLKEQIDTINTNHIPGISATAPDQVFGMDLTIDQNGYLSMPPHLAFLGDGRDGVVSSKLGHARLHLDNINYSFHFSNLPLADAIKLVSHAADIEVILSPRIIENETLVQFDIEAGAISALDALFHQYDIAMIYDPELEVAQIYTDAEFETRLSRISQAIESHNSSHHRQLQIDALSTQHQALEQLLSAIHSYHYASTNTQKLDAASTILDALPLADTSLTGIFSNHATLDAWLNAAMELNRWGDDPDVTPDIALADVTSSHPLVQSARQNMIQHHQQQIKQLEQFDTETLAYLTGQPVQASEPVFTQTDTNYVDAFARFKHLAIKDDCIAPSHEIFTEKVAVYGGENAMLRISTILDSYFAHQTESLPDQTEQVTEPHDNCARQSYPEQLNYVQANDASGYVVTGYNEDIELLVRLVEQFDRPQRQVLIEVYMINVVKDFNRKLDLTFQTDALASDSSETGGFFLRRDLTDLGHSVTSQSPGGFVSGLISPNNQVEALVDFIETNNLGQTISSPTILVEEGGSASVTRTNTKPVTRVSQQTLLDSNNNLIEVPVSETVEESVSFTLDVADIKINPNNNNVTLKFALKDQSFETSLANVDATTGKTEDAINTSFVAAPGDVIILAGLFKQIDTTAASGLPGTTRTNVPTAFLLGGEDQITNKTEEMIILMAPTVIEPEIGRKSPHSALD